MRTMWVHAYQSHVWNSLACSRIRLLGAGAVPGDLVLLDDNTVGTGTATATGTADSGVTTPRPPQDGKDDVPGAETTSTPSASSGLGEAGGGTSEPSGVGGGGARGDGVSSGPAKKTAKRTAKTAKRLAERAAAAGETSKAAAGSGQTKAAVTVLTREAMESFASQGVTARELLRRVVLPLAGTSVQYPHHGVSLGGSCTYRNLPK